MPRDSEYSIRPNPWILSGLIVPRGPPVFIREGRLRLPSITNQPPSIESETSLDVLAKILYPCIEKNGMD